MRLLMIVLAAATFACGARPPLGSSFPQQPGRLAEVLARVKSTPRAAERSVVVGVTAAPHALFAFDLGAGRLLFQLPTAAVALPFVAGERVVVPAQGSVTVHDLADGRVVRTLASDGMQLVGAAGDEHVTAIVLSTGGAFETRSRLVLLDARDGSVRADHTVARTIGLPAVTSGLVFLPHNRVHLSVLDADGRELARVRITDDVASEAVATAGDVYFGQRALTLLDTETERGHGKGAHAFVPAASAKLPGRPALLTDGSSPPPAPTSAVHRVHLAFTPTRAPDGQVTLRDDSLYLTYYKSLFALTPDGAHAHWAHQSERDVVGAEAVAGGLLVVDEGGAVTALDRRGEVAFTRVLGLSPVAARVRASTLAIPSAEPSGAARATQLAEAARQPDMRLVPASALAATLLGDVEDDEAAAALIALCAGSATPTQVRTAACEALAGRRHASDAVLAALAQHASFLDATPPPPVRALAEAALHAGDRRAADPLLAQLGDPATPPAAIAAIVRALAALGEPRHAQPLAAFVRLYHADVDDSDLDAALGSALDAVIALDAKRARRTLEWIVSDGLSDLELRKAAERKLSALGPAPDASDENAPSESTEREPSPELLAPDDEPGLPTHLTTQDIEDTLSPVRAKLARCVRDAPERPASARLVLVIEPDGHASDVRALPTSVEPCVAPLVKTVTFSGTRYGRRSVMSYSVSR